jgi:hypothetical protein
LLALSVTISCAVLVPVIVGDNITLIVQLALPGSVDPHVVDDMKKSPGFAPPITIELIVMVTDPVLVKTNAFGLLFVSIFCLGKVNFVGVSVAFPTGGVVESVKFTSVTPSAIVT